jgi:phosphodiesterase/alkaline phosphatase D-like protein
VTPTSASFDAQVNPGFGPTLVRFEYGTTTSYGSRTYPTDSIGDDNADHPASIDVSGLTPATTYHLRALATNFSGIAKGPDQTFTTPDLPAVVETAATEVTQTTATLGASVRPGFRATTYHFEYGLTDSYGLSTTESASVGSDNSAHPASAALNGLKAETTYHYRIVATNAIGTTTGPDQAFTTAEPAATKSSPPPPRCKHGFLMRHGKCVKAHHHKRKHHKGSHR